MKFKYLNLNIWDGGALLNNALEFFKQEKPDILSLQEVRQTSGQGAGQFNTILAVKEALGLAYEYFSPARFKIMNGQRVEMGQAIISRWPILNPQSKFVLGSYGEQPDWSSEAEKVSVVSAHARNFLSCAITAPQGQVNVFNLHGIWGTHGSDTPERLKMIESVLKEIGNKENVILSGDFNLNENIYPPIKTPGISETGFRSQTDVIEKKDDNLMGFNRRVNPEANEKPDLSKPQRTQSVKLLEEKLINVFKDERITSFNPRRKDFPNTGYGTAVVDMVFVSPNIKVLSHIQPDVDVSDHMPQIVDLQV